MSCQTTSPATSRWVTAASRAAGWPRSSSPVAPQRGRSHGGRPRGTGAPRLGSPERAAVRTALILLASRRRPAGARARRSRPRARPTSTPGASIFCVKGRTEPLRVLRDAPTPSRDRSGSSTSCSSLAALHPEDEQDDDQDAEHDQADQARGRRDARRPARRTPRAGPPRGRLRFGPSGGPGSRPSQARRRSRSRYCRRRSLMPRRDPCRMYRACRRERILSSAANLKDGGRRRSRGLAAWSWIATSRCVRSGAAGSGSVWLARDEQQGSRSP